MKGRPRLRMGSALRRQVAVAVSAVLVGALLQGAGAPSSAASSRSKPSAMPPGLEKPVAGKAAGKAKPRPLFKGPRTPARAPKASWTDGGSALLRLSTSTTKRSATPTRAGDLPVALTLRPPTGPAKRAADDQGSAERSLRIRVVEHKKAQQAGVNGLLFTLTPEAERRGQTDRAAVQVDYSAFSEAFGGGYASRLQLLELPACALATHHKPACRVGTPVRAVNDEEKRTLTTDGVPLRGGATTVLAAVAAESGEKGDYKATSLSPSATWSTNLNTGDFAWSYDMPTPEVPGGLKPSVGLSYTSGAIDGRTGGTNNQSSWAGDGFEMWPGYIERRYKPCSDDGIEHADGNKPGDLCWGYDNATISFNGMAGELVPAGHDEWKLKQDDGTKIKRVSDKDRNNGDDNGEYWVLTTPDGTSYYFGYNKLSGWASGKETTNSAWNVPVFGDDADEPCHASSFAASWCQQAWRWNLDYIVDVHGNAVAYYYDKETNSYGRDLKEADDTPYVRGGYLDRIEYGLKSTNVYTGKALAKVNFSSSERCIPDPKQQITCDPDTIESKAPYWYDTPWDLNCKTDTKCDQGRLSPSFWTRKRLTEVTTTVLKDDTYTKVDSWKLDHHWGTADVDYQLLLDEIQHTGHSAATPITLPKTTLTYTQQTNRLDKTGDGKAPFIKARLSTVADESGGQTDVNYSKPACVRGSLPAPQTNTTRCFPQYIGGSSSDGPDEEWFNKYVVESVTATDRTGGAPDQVTRYTYPDGAAWHYDDDDGLTKEKYKTWSQWRGYGHVRVETGGQGTDSMRTQEETYFLRGMDGDRKSPSGGTRDVTVTLDDGEGEPITDHESAAGFAYKSVTFSGPGGKALEKTVNRPWHHETAKRVRSWGTVTANLIGTSYTKNFTSLDNGDGQKWRTTSSSTSFDTVAGRPVQVDDFGDTTTADDNQCTRTTYADNTAANILTLPSREETVAVKCDDTPDRSKDVISDVRTAYDGGTYDAAPTKGDATATSTLKEHDGKKATYLESGVTYDSYGRELTSIDLTATVTASGTGALSRSARSDGRTTKTTYTPATGIPVKTTVTTPPATKGDATTAQTTTTELDPLRGQPTAEVDTNNKRTEFAYDALGRSTKVWLADRRTSQLPTYEFSYFITEGDAVAVRTQTLTPAGGAQIASYTLYDGLLRARQTQAPGPQGGRIITDTFYDERGLTAKTFAPYYAEARPQTRLFEPDNALSVETQSRYTYDGLGRETEAKQIAGNGDGGTVLSTTRTIYGGDRTTVIPPEGGTATTTVTDSRGKTIELQQHHTRATEAAADTTHYRYTPAGQLAQVTDPAGNVWKYAYDQLGRQINSSDPDKGTTKSTYDDRSQLTSTTDARRVTLANTYDDLGRRTELHEGTTDGPLRAKWVFDTISGAKGQLAESTRYVDSAAYTNKITTYDRLYRPMKTATVIPEREHELAGTYESGTDYHANGLVAATSYSAAGALPGGGINYTYEDDTLRPIKVYDGRGMSATTSYSLTGKPYAYQLTGVSGGKTTSVTNTYEWGTQRLATTRVDRQDIAGVDQYATYGYDPAGNVTSVSDVSRPGTDTQCFTYDYLRRLTEAWTQPTKTCADTPSAGTTGGPAPYWQSYTYDKTGNRLTETQHDPAGDSAKDTKRDYHYPAPGATSKQPHALTSIATTGPTGQSEESYGYDEAGNTATRTRSGDTQKLTWDAEGHLAKVSQPREGGADQVTEYLYDADGNRLISRTPTETTLYLGPTEITLAKGSKTPKATRYTDLGGGNQAVRADDNTVSLTLADHHGTAQLAIDAQSLKLTQRRTTPFGTPRGEQPSTWPGTKGFVGGTIDTTTGLTHLGAREYDPATGRFISVDPVMDLTDPQQINGYTYANNTPVTMSDPTGMCPEESCAGRGPIGPRWPGSGGGGAGHGGGGHRSRGHGGGGGGYSSPVNTGAAARARYRCQYGCGPITGFGPRVDALARKKMAENAALPDPWDVITKFTLKAIKVLDPTKNARECPGEWDADTCSAAALDATGITKFRLLKQVAKKAVERAEEAWSARSNKSKEHSSSGKAESACHSFLPGTEVLLADGTAKPIEDVQLGDTIKVTDPKTGKTTARKVVGTIITKDDKEFVDLTVNASKGKGAAALVSTSTHPFWVDSERKWIKAGDLKPGMTLHAPSGGRVTVKGARHFVKYQRTHDLTVAGVHTYYVLADRTPVLVHNCDEWTSQGNLDIHYGKHADDMGYDSQIEYREAAKDLTCDCDGGRPGIMRKFDDSSDEGATIRYFDPSTGEYGMKGPRGIITFYELDGGINTFKQMPGTSWKPGDPSW
uniref:polymorphic toxin-type HINT domain-containing protein n=1 Tax=Streptomyces asiaticus TaxID=114695 RepID=UPI00374CEA8F